MQLADDALHRGQAKCRLQLRVGVKWIRLSFLCVQLFLEARLQVTQ